MMKILNRIVRIQLLLASLNFHSGGWFLLWLFWAFCFVLLLFVRVFVCVVIVCLFIFVVI